MKQLIDAGHFKGANINNLHPIITACLIDALINMRSVHWSEIPFVKAFPPLVKT